MGRFGRLEKGALLGESMLSTSESSDSTEDASSLSWSRWVRRPPELPPGFSVYSATYCSITGKAL